MIPEFFIEWYAEYHNQKHEDIEILLTQKHIINTLKF